MRRRKSNSGLTFHRREKKKFNISTFYEIITWVSGIAVAAFLGFILVFFFGYKTKIVGTSMEPSLANGQDVLLNRVVYQFSSPARGDVIAFYPNGNRNSHLYVKRVVGMPGETIAIHDGYVFIDGIRYFDDVADYTEDPGIADSDFTLEIGEYFVLGDNRDNSEDSRSANIGVVTKEMVEGKAWYHLGNTKDKRGMVE